jgi:isoquinoline 1-oxidoreductase subunit alpha
MATYRLNVNGQPLTATADPTTPLLWVLRDHLGMTGTKYGCGISACGACTVHLDGRAARSCVLPIAQLHDRAVVTIEAMSDDPIGRIVQQTWIDQDVVQCGYCQSGQIMNAVSLLKMTRTPSETDIEASMGGSICRCGTYVRIRDAVRAASTQLA